MALTMVLAAYLIVQIAQRAFSHDLAKHTIYRYAIGYAGDGFTLIYGYLVSSHKAISYGESPRLLRRQARNEDTC